MVVRDDQELTPRAELGDHLTEAIHVRVVERRVDLVQDRERARVDLIEREHQRQGCKRSLAGGKKRHVLQSLAWRLDKDLDPGARTVVTVGVAKRGAAA